MNDVTDAYARSLMKRSKNKTVSAGTQIEPIFTGYDLIYFQEAVKHRSELVTINGRTFKLRYDGYRVLFNPETGHVPCGVFEIEKVLAAKDAL